MVFSRPGEEVPDAPYSPRAPMSAQAPGAIPFWRMPAFYFLHFFAVGAMLPFLNIFYHSVGVSGFQLGLLNAAPRLSSALAPPLFGALADKFRLGRSVAFTCAVASSLLAFLLWGASGFLALFVLITLFSALRAPLVPIAENLCLREIEATGAQYGRVRLWGSLGFIVAAMGAGRLVETTEVASIFPVVACVGLLLVFVIFHLPKETGRARPRFRADLSLLLRSSPLAAFLLTTTFASMSAGPFGIYFSIRLKELGMSADLIALAWTVGVVSEIFFLIYAQAIQRRFGLKWMIVAGMMAAGLRWEFVALTTDAFLLILIQLLHGVAFGVFHAGAIQYVDRLSSAATKNTAQSLYSAATWGVGSTLGALTAGWLLPIWGFVTLLHVGAAIALLAGLAFAVFGEDVK